MPQANEAQEAYEQAIEWSSRGREDDAIVEYERALALGLQVDDRATALLGLGHSLRAAGRHEESVKILQAAIAEFADHAALRAQLALSLHSSGEGRQAMVEMLNLVLRYAPVGTHGRLLSAQRDMLRRTQNVAQGVLEMARELTRIEFARRFDHPFLFGLGPTRSIAEARDEDTQIGTRFEELTDKDVPAAPAVIAVKKSSTNLPSAVTLGRTSSNDLVVKDGHISKVHAFFREVGGRWELADAGSRNGTWIGHDRLIPRGPALPIHTGDVISFGRSPFYFLDAGALWDRLRAYRR